MLSIRTQLREAVIQRLRVSKKLQARVRAELSMPTAIQELPFITISIDKSSIISDWSAINTEVELLEMIEQPIVIKIMAAGNALDEKLEQLAAIISHILAQDETLGGLVKTLRLEEDAELLISHEGEQPIGTLTMRFITLYRRPALQLNKTCS